MSNHEHSVYKQHHDPKTGWLHQYCECGEERVTRPDTLWDWTIRIVVAVPVALVAFLMVYFFWGGPRAIEVEAQFLCGYLFSLQ
jgi:hypothetical protein